MGLWVLLSLIGILLFSKFAGQHRTSRRVICQADCLAEAAGKLPRPWCMISCAVCFGELLTLLCDAFANSIFVQGVNILSVFDGNASSDKAGEDARTAGCGGMPKVTEREGIHIPEK